jgi:hypothetical protein
MGELLINIAPLALGAAVNPGMTAAVMALLLSATQPLSRAVAFLIGAVATSAVAGVLGLTALSSLGAVRHSGGHARGESLFFLCAGLLLLIIAGWHAVSRPAPKATSRSEYPNNTFRRLSGRGRMASCSPF